MYGCKFFITARQFAEGFREELKDLIQKRLDGLERDMNTVDYVKLSSLDIDTLILRSGFFPESRRLQETCNEIFDKRTLKERNKKALSHIRILGEKDTKMGRNKSWCESLDSYRERLYGIRRKDWEDLANMLYNILNMTFKLRNEEDDK